MVAIKTAAAGAARMTARQLARRDDNEQAESSKVSAISIALSDENETVNFDAIRQSGPDLIAEIGNEIVRQAAEVPRRSQGAGSAKPRIRSGLAGCWVRCRLAAGPIDTAEADLQASAARQCGAEMRPHRPRCQACNAAHRGVIVLMLFYLGVAGRAGPACN